MSDFWKTWLNAWCGAVVLFGAVLCGAGFEATSGPAQAAFHLLGPGRPLALDDPALRFSIALMGAVTLGWGLTLTAAIRAADLLGARGAGVWRRMGLAFVVWYLVDSALSVATGFALNAVSNTVFLAAFSAPAAFGRRGRPIPQP